MLLRSGVIGVSAYLQRLGEILTRVYPDAGSAQAEPRGRRASTRGTCCIGPSRIIRIRRISYYTKGALVALALDLTLRLDTAGRTSLDDVVRELWRRYGARGVGVPEDGFERLAAEISGVDLGAFFDGAVRGTEDLPLKELLAEFGVSLEMRATSGADDRGGTRARRERRAAVARRSRARARARARAHERARRRRGRARGLEPRRRARRDRPPARDGPQPGSPSGSVRERRASHGQRCFAATSSSKSDSCSRPRRSIPAT